MAEESDARVSGHVAVERAKGGHALTARDLRLLLDGVEKAGFPDSSEVRVRTSWKADKHGSVPKRITVVTPE